MVENQLERCIEDPFKFGAEYHPYFTLSARPDVAPITFKDRFKPVAVMNKDRTEEEILTHSGSLPSNVLVFSFTNITLEKPAASSMVSKDDGVANGPFGRLRSTMPKSKPSSCETVMPVPSLSKYSSSSTERHP